MTLVLGALTAGHFALVPAAGSVLAMAAVLLVAGAAIAPTYAGIYAMVERAAPDGTVTEASFLLAAGAGAVATLILMLRAGTLGAARGAVAAAQPAGA
jgi:N-methylhydantoinase B/oxoprolinase/acetone carboxylase alpha subunit